MTIIDETQTETQADGATKADGAVTRDPAYTVAFRYKREQIGTYRIVHVRADDGLALPPEGELAKVIERYLRRMNKDAIISSEVKHGDSKSLNLTDIYSNEEVRFLKEAPKRAERRSNGGKTDTEKIHTAIRKYAKEDGMPERDAFNRAAADLGWTQERADMLWEVEHMS